MKMRARRRKRIRLMANKLCRRRDAGASGKQLKLLSKVVIRLSINLSKLEKVSQTRSSKEVGL